jgi:hypothetical protein
MPERARTARLALAAAPLAAALGLLGACARGPVFPEYFYPGSAELVNLVSDRSFSADWTVGPSAAELGAATSLYVTFQDASADAAAAGISAPALAAPLLASGEIYRLEIGSLASGGDFSGVAAGAVGLGTPTAGWVYSPSPDPGAVHEILAGTEANAIDGNTLHFKTAAPASRMDYALRSNLADGFLEGATYLARFRYRAADGTKLVFEFRDAAYTVNDLTWIVYGGVGGAGPSHLDSIVEFPPASVASSYGVFGPDEDPAHAFFLSFGSMNAEAQFPQDAYIDDFRVLRADGPPRAELRLGYELTLPVVDDAASFYTAKAGSYRFGIYVHDDPTAAAHPDRYLCRAFTVTIAGGNVDGDGAPIDRTVTSRTIRTRGDLGWGDAYTPGWVLVTLETDSLPLASTAAPDAAVILVTITPTDYTSEAGMLFDAGSILVSSPTLEFTSAIE